MAAAKPHMPQFADVGILVDLVKTTFPMAEMKLDHLEAAETIFAERSISYEGVKGAVESVLKETEQHVIGWCGMQVTWVY